jgi:hypothetical protein
LTGLVLGAVAVAAAGALLLLSRWMASTFRGRWFAGNGRDVFHAGAVIVAAAALFANGLPPALACLWAAFAITVPLLLLDSLQGPRLGRAALLLALVALATVPAFLEPQSIVETANAVARLLF